MSATKSKSKGVQGGQCGLEGEEEGRRRGGVDRQVRRKTSCSCRITTDFTNNDRNEI